MTTWNYRPVARTHGENSWVELREVFYNDRGEPSAISTVISALGNDREDLIGTLEMMLKDARERPMFELPAEWLKDEA